MAIVSFCLDHWVLVIVHYRLLSWDYNSKSETIPTKYPVVTWRWKEVYPYQSTHHQLRLLADVSSRHTCSQVWKDCCHCTFFTYMYYRIYSFLWLNVHVLRSYQRCLSLCLACLSKAMPKLLGKFSQNTNYSVSQVPCSVIVSVTVFEQFCYHADVIMAILSKIWWRW